MTELHSEQFALYHGTGATLVPGDVVGPVDSPAHGQRVAFASKQATMAQSYAQYVNTPEGGERPKVGHVYEVEPLDPAEVRHHTHESLSNKGFRVKRHVSSHPVLGDAD